MREFVKMIDFWESRRLCPCVGLYVCLRKTKDGPELSVGVDLKVLCKQEVKANTELETAWLSIKVVP